MISYIALGTNQFITETEQTSGKNGKSSSTTTEFPLSTGEGTVIWENQNKDGDDNMIFKIMTNSP